MPDFETRMAIIMRKMQSDGIYIPDAKTYIKEFCRSIFGTGYKKQFVQQIIDKIII